MRETETSGKRERETERERERGARQNVLSYQQLAVRDRRYATRARQKHKRDGEREDKQATGISNKREVVETF